MNDAELETALRRMTRGSTTGIILVGGGTAAMGFFALVCGALRLDPEMRHYSMGMWIAYGLMVLFFGGGGLLMVAAGLFIVPRRADDFVNRVFHRPETFSHLWLLLIKSNMVSGDQPGQLGVGTSLCAQTVDGKHFQFTVKGANAQMLLEEIARRAPNAHRGPPA